MSSLALSEFHAALDATFGELNGMEMVESYGNTTAEFSALRDTVGILDLSFRSRICLLGADRQKFLNGQITNNVKDLKNGEGCYATLITGKGKIQSDLNIYILENEMLLDFEPGLTKAVLERLEKYIIADDVQMMDVSPHYGLLSVQGPKAAEVISRLQLDLAIPEKVMNFSSVKNETLGEIYLMNHPRAAHAGFDLFIPTGSLAAIADKLIAAAKENGGRACGWEALEIVRIEAGVPRFGQDMDETNLPPEAGLESRAISYNKGCYIGQEVIARIRTYGQVAKALRGLKLADDLPSLPAKGDKVFLGEKEIGYITSAIASPTFQKNIALGYIRREANKIGTELVLQTKDGKSPVKVAALPFQFKASDFSAS